MEANEGALGRKPDFLVIGAMKSATTSLCNLLAAHPRVHITDPKEPDFFCKDDVYARGWSWYSERFHPAKEEDVLGEGSTSYTKAHVFPESARRIAHDLPAVKLIFMARHPLDRIVSHWMQSYADGTGIPADFNRAVRERDFFVQTSRYWWQLAPYRDRFPDDQLHVAFFEDFQADSGEVLRGVQRFLGIEEMGPPESTSDHAHRSADKFVEHPMIRTLRQWPVVEASLARIPRGLREPIRRRTGRRMDVKPVWDPEVKSRVCDTLREDARQFCTDFGKPADYWSL